MTSDSTDWTQEAELDPEKEYRALVRSIRYSRGFSLLFVQCSPAEGTRLIKQVREDLPTKKIKVLTLEKAINNLFDQVAALPNHDQLDALFIQGIEHSLFEYEGTQLWGGDSDDRRSYSQKSVPRLLGHLNLGRERFRDHFKFCFIFLVPRFVVKYLVRRAPDFFDWRSGVLEFAMDVERLQQESQQIYFAGFEWKNYLSLTPEQRREEILKIQALLEEPEQTPEQKVRLYHKQALALQSIEEHEDAIAGYDRVVAIKSDYHKAWNNRGNSLHNLGRYEEAITSYDRAVAIKSDYHEAWNNRGISLHNLGRYEEALASYNKSLEFSPNHANALYNKACCYGLQGRVDKAIEQLKQAINLNSECRGIAKTDSDFDSIRNDDRFQALINHNQNE